MYILPVSENRYGGPANDTLTFEFPPLHNAHQNQEEGERVIPAPRWIIISTHPSNPVQRCDAQRPCTTCITAKIVSECVYDNGRHPQSAGVYPLHRADDHSPDQDPGSAHPVETTVVTSAHPPAHQILIPSTSDATVAITHESSVLQTSEADYDQPPHGRSLELVRVRRNSSGRRVSLDSNPSISSHPLSKIPPELQIPLSFFGGEWLRVQTSELAATDLDVKWYA